MLTISAPSACPRLEHRSSFRPLRLLCLLLLYLALLPAALPRPARAVAATAPAGLSPAEWAGIVAQVEGRASSAPLAGAGQQQGYLKASNTATDSAFGYAVAVYSDTLVVGAAQESTTITGSGAAYVFVRSGGVWSQQAFLKASNPGIFDKFGTAVAIWGDTIVVGTPFEDSAATGVDGNQADNSANEAGAAYVFVRTGGTTWSQQAYLKASNTGIGDVFSNVAIDGENIVVGAPREESAATGVNGNQADNSALSAGAAYVFVRTGGTTWSQQAYLKASNTQANDRFGDGVTVSGKTVVVGASSEDSSAKGINGKQGNNSAEDAGAAYVFVRKAGAWKQQAYLKASNTQAGDLFGRRLGLAGNLLVVSAIDEDSKATGLNGKQTNNTALSSGAAYVFIRAAGKWRQKDYVKASNAEGGDSFGDDVAISGATIVVGASGEDSAATGVDGNQADNSATYSGAAYVIDVGNMLKNGDFEQDANADARPDYWSSNGAFTRSSVMVHSGSFAGRHKAGDDRDYSITQQARSLTGGKSYNVGCYVNIPATSDVFTFKLQVRWKKADGSTISTQTILTRTAATSGWEPGFTPLLAPAGTASAELRMVVASLSATIYVDACTIN